MLRKHINDDTLHSVDVKDRDDVVGPCNCPQSGCQSSDGDFPYKKGNVVLEEYGGGSGDYVTSYACKCCDSKGILYSGERPYRNYCFSFSVRDISTIYPSPFPMPRTVYDDPELIKRVQRKKQSQSQDKQSEENESTCYIATAVYGSSSDSSVIALRAFRDRHLNTNFFGRFFVLIYYKTSPPLARWLKDSHFANEMARQVLDRLVTAIKEKK